MRKLTENEVKELQKLEIKPHGDMLYWERLEDIYKNDEEVLLKINFMKNYLLSVQAIPMGYASRLKSECTYMDTVNDFNKEIGYESEVKEEYEDCLLEEIAAKFGIDIDINGDGKTSFEKYRKKQK